MQRLALSLALVCVIALTLALTSSAPVVAASPLPSELSGTYVGTGTLAGWTCDLCAYEIRTTDNGNNRVLAADCQAPTGRYGGAVSTNDTCPTSEYTQPPMVRFGDTCGPAPYFCVPPSTPRLSVISYLPSTPLCSLGQVKVSIGSDTAFMCRTQIIIPTYTYPGCGAAPAPVLKPRIRGP